MEIRFRNSPVQFLPGSNRKGLPRQAEIREMSPSYCRQMLSILNFKKKAVHGGLADYLPQIVSASLAIKCKAILSITNLSP
jgi:hypothetical protein